MRDFHLHFFSAKPSRGIIPLLRYHFTLEVFLFVQENQNNFDFLERTKIVRAELTLLTNQMS